MQQGVLFPHRNPLPHVLFLPMGSFSHGSIWWAEAGRAAVGDGRSVGLLGGGAVGFAGAAAVVVAGLGAALEGGGGDGGDGGAMLERVQVPNKGLQPAPQYGSLEPLIFARC
jgi:hypothetical protein